MLFSAVAAIVLVLGGMNAEVHEVIPGDTCWGITESYGLPGNRYPELYAKNQQLIEDWAGAHGFASSDYCHWIWPGELLAIPNNWLPPAEAPAETESTPATSVTPRTPTPTPVPTPSPTQVVPGPETGTPEGGGKNWYENWWVYVLAVLAVVVLGLIIARRRAGGTERPRLRPQVDPLPSIAEVIARFGQYSRRRHKELWREVQRRSQEAAQALVAFGVSSFNEKKILKAAKDQLALQRAFTVWALNGLKRLNSDGTVTLYRGFQDHDIAEQVAREGLTTKTCSFTFSRPTAKAFDGGGVIIANVPVDLIAGSYLSAPYPFRHEFEVTVLAGRIRNAQLYSLDQVPDLGPAPSHVEGR